MCDCSDSITNSTGGQTITTKSTVTPGTYGSTSNVGQFTVSKTGIITAASNIQIAGGSGGSQWTGTIGSPIYYEPPVGIGSSATATSTLQVTGNLYVSNAITTPRISAKTANIGTLNVATISNLNSLTTPQANVGTLNVATISNLNSLTLSNNLYAANAITASKYYGDGGLLSNITSFVQPLTNLVVSNSVTTTNVNASGALQVTGSMTAKVGNTTFFYDTFTIPYINAQVINAASIIGTTNISTLNVQTLYASSAVIYGSNTLNVYGISNLNSVIASLANIGTLNVGTISNLNSLVTTLYGPVAGQNLVSASNIYSANGLATTNVSASLANIGTLNVGTISNLNSLVTTLYGPVAGQNLVSASNIYSANGLATTNVNALGFLINGVTGTAGQVITATGTGAGIQWGSGGGGGGPSQWTNVGSTSAIYVVANVAIGSSTAPSSNLEVTGNIYASNALTTRNVFANVMTMANATSTISVTGNIYSSNAVSTTNVFATGFTSNSTNTIFNYDTLTIPFLYATSVVPTYPVSFKNRIINGDFIIDQRNAGASTTPSTGPTRVIDRWKVEIAGSGRCLVGQNLGAIASPAGLTSYYGMSVSTTTTPGSGDYFFLSQVIEGINTVDWVWGQSTAKPVTLSFWVYSSLTGTGGGFIRNAGESAGNYTRSWPFSYTISSTNTWEYKTVAITGDIIGQWISGQLDGVEVGFEMWNGSTYQNASGAWAGGNFTGPSNATINYAGTLSSNLYLTGVQIEAGTVASPFERRHIAFELAQCQRYYEPSVARLGGYNTTGVALRSSVYFNVKKRPKASPTFTVISTPESNNIGALTIDNSNFDQSSARIVALVTATGDAYGQWKVSVDCEF